MKWNARHIEIYEKLEYNWLQKINCRLHWTDERFRYRRFVCVKSKKFHSWSLYSTNAREKRREEMKRKSIARILHEIHIFDHATQSAMELRLNSRFVFFFIFIMSIDLSICMWINFSLFPSELLIRPHCCDPIWAIPAKRTCLQLIMKFSLNPLLIASHHDF